MKIKGKAWKFGENIDTDVIYPAKYLVSFEPEEVAKHAMEGLDPEFIKKIVQNDIIVAGKNFGCGSAREQAATALKYAGIGIVIADSFSRTFFRNAINVGLPVLFLKDISQKIKEGEELEVILEKGEIKNLSSGETIQAPPLPDFVLKILEAGGAIEYYKDQLPR